MWENTTPSTELPRDFCAGIGPLQLGVVLVCFLSPLKKSKHLKTCILVTYLCVRYLGVCVIVYYVSPDVRDNTYGSVDTCTFFISPVAKKERRLRKYCRKE